MVKHQTQYLFWLRYDSAFLVLLFDNWSYHAHRPKHQSTCCVLRYRNHREKRKQRWWSHSNLRDVFRVMKQNLNVRVVQTYQEHIVLIDGGPWYQNSRCLFETTIRWKSWISNVEYVEQSTKIFHSAQRGVRCTTTFATLIGIVKSYLHHETCEKIVVRNDWHRITIIAVFEALLRCWRKYTIRVSSDQTARCDVRCSCFDRSVWETFRCSVRK